MKINLKRLITVVLAISLLCTVIAGCDKQSSEPNESAKPEQVEEPTIKDVTEKEDIVVSYFKWWSGFQPPYEDNVIGEIIRENTGVTIEWIVPPSDPIEKINAYLASGEFPDVIEIEDATVKNNLIDAQAIIPLEGMLSNYPSLDMNLGKLKNILKHSDGHIYHLPRWYGVDGESMFPEHWCEIYTRTGYLLGKGNYMPETFADFESLLQEVKENTEMIPCMIPLAQEGIVNALYQHLGGSQGIVHYEDIVKKADGSLGHIIKEQGFRDALKVVNNWYQSGLISEESITLQNDLLEEKVLAGDVFAVIGTSLEPHAPTFQTNLEAQGQEKESFILHYLKYDESVEKETQITNQDTYSNGYALTSTNEHPERFMDVVEFLNSREGFFAGVNGLVIEHGTAASEGYDFYTNEDNELWATDWQAKQLENDEFYVQKQGVWTYDWTPIGCIWKTVPEVDCLALEDGLDVWRDDVTREHLAALNYSGDKYWAVERAHAVNVTEIAKLPLDPNSKAQMTKIDIDDYINKTIPKLIVSESNAEFDALYDDMITTVEDYGLQTLIDEWERLYIERQELWGE